MSGHPLDSFPHVDWDSYVQIGDLARYGEKRLKIAGLIIESRMHRQTDGRPMKFISLCDYSGVVECELFADVYQRFGTATVRFPVVEVIGKVQPFKNGNGHTLQVLYVGEARNC
ncbi:MAG: OB-fold nucleic acid binding domain-containing protein [Chthoniobacterales bacterium]